MKIYFALIALTFCTVVQAQFKKRNWDARLAINNYAYPYFKAGGKFEFLNFFGPDILENSFSAEILYQPGNKKIKTGIAMSYSHIKRYDRSSIDFLGSSNHSRRLTQKLNSVALMTVFNYSYLIKNYVQLYSAACFGIANSNHNFYEKQTQIHSINPAFQCSLIGCRIGNRIAGFTELGYGYKGVIQIGISGSF